MVAKARRGSVDMSTLQNARAAVDHLGRPLQMVDHLGRPINKASKKQKQNMAPVQAAAVASAPVEDVPAGPFDGFCAVLTIMSEFVVTAFEAVCQHHDSRLRIFSSAPACSVRSWLAIAQH